MIKQPYIYKVKMLKVVDGDTFDFNIDMGFNVWCKERVRLKGIDTPEIPGLTGAAASAFAEDWLMNAMQLYLHSIKYDDREKYGRVLGDIYRDNDTQPLSAALRAAGHVKM